MVEQKAHGSWVILISVGIAYLLSLSPMPEWAAPWRPDWVGMVLIYWCMALPNRISVGAAWSIGLLDDVLTASLLGQHALGYTLVAAITVALHQRLRIFPRWQQSVVVFGLITLSVLPAQWAKGMMGRGPEDLSFLYPAITSMLLWHWLFIVLRDARRTFHVT